MRHSCTQGKSSITVALFRLVEIESGRMLLDGIDLASLGLSDVRGRGMAIIPQGEKEMKFFVCFLC